MGVLLIWAICATNPLYLNEVANALEKPSALEELSVADDAAVALGERIRKRYGLLLKLVRDDGVSTGWFGNQSSSLLIEPFSFIPSSTIVEFAHPATVEHVREYLFNNTAQIPPLFLACGTKLDANITVLKSCLEALKMPSMGHHFSLRNYASYHWVKQPKSVHHVRNMSRPRPEAFAMYPRADMIRLLYHVMTDAEVIPWWCTNSCRDIYTTDTANMIADCAGMWFDPSEFDKDDPVSNWVIKSIKYPPSVSDGHANSLASRGMHGKWVLCALGIND